jgi:cell division protein FtsN
MIAAGDASGGYTVQLASARSASAAHTSFRVLRAKFANELGGREPIVRRVSLGVRGIYYRAMVGPFSSMEKAVGMCKTLKAAGGECVIQKY